MSNIDNLGKYGEFAQDADKYIKQIQSDAVDDASLKQHAEGAVLGVVLVGALVGCAKLGNFAVTQYKSTSEERKESTAVAKAKLKAVLRKMQNLGDSGVTPSDRDGETPAQGIED